MGRGVLLDYASWAVSQGLTLSTHTTTPIPLSTLLACAAAQEVTFKPADILFIRTGFIQNCVSLSGAEAAQYAAVVPAHASTCSRLPLDSLL